MRLARARGSEEEQAAARRGSHPICLRPFPSAAQRVLIAGQRGEVVEASVRELPRYPGLSPKDVGPLLRVLGCLSCPTDGAIAIGRKAVAEDAELSGHEPLTTVHALRFELILRLR